MIIYLFTKIECKYVVNPSFTLISSAKVYICRSCPNVRHRVIEQPATEICKQDRSFWVNMQHIFNILVIGPSVHQMSIILDILFSEIMWNSFQVARNVHQVLSCCY